MRMCRPRFLTPTNSALLLVFAALSLTACAGMTGPARRHLAAVEAAEQALTLPDPERKRALESARDELRSVLDTSPGLAGARLSLATLHARLDEPKLALALAPPLDEQRPEERPSWSALEVWALARAGRWDELIAKHSARLPDAEVPVAARYRDFAVVATPCERANPDNTTPAAAAAPTSPKDDTAQAAPSEPPSACCTETSTSCRDCLAAAREAWCQAAPLHQPIERTLAITEGSSPSPHLELARARLRATALAAAGRHDEARLALETAREAAQKLAAEPAPNATSSTPPPLPLAVLSLDLDRAILFAWSGELEQSRAILTTLQAASPPEPLLSRLMALANALTPPAP